MRLPAVALAATFCGLAPFAADAQTVVQTYAANACARGVVRYDGFTPVVGTVACLSGPVRIEYQAGMGDGLPPLIRFTGDLTADFGDAFTGDALGTEYGIFRFTAVANGRTVPGSTDFSFGAVPPFWVVGQTGASYFRSTSEPVVPSTDLASIGNVTALFGLRYRLPNTPSGFGPDGVALSLTLTPVPEPSTLALGATGLALGGVVRRRRAVADV